MKKSLFVLGLLFTTVTTPALFAADSEFTMHPSPLVVSTGNDVVAAAGCCKRRKAEGKPWKKTKDDIKSCKKQNDEVDKDDAFKPKGLIWWDIAC